MTLKPGYIVVHDGQPTLILFSLRKISLLKEKTTEPSQDNNNRLQHDATKRRGLRAY